MKLNAAAFSRKNTKSRRARPNEDAYHFDVSRGLYVVADGVSLNPQRGMPYPDPSRGVMASQALCDVLAALPLPPADADARRWLRNAISKANDQLREMNQSWLDNRPINFKDVDLAGTVCVAGVVIGGQLVFLYIGDCAVYSLRGDGLDRLTRRQTVQAEQYYHSLEQQGIEYSDRLALMRERFRNRLDPVTFNAYDGGYGVLDGTPAALAFAIIDSLDLCTGQAVIFATDGLDDRVVAQREHLIQACRSSADANQLVRIVFDPACDKPNTERDDETCIILTIG